jgi:hypothetical protein
MNIVDVDSDSDFNPGAYVPEPTAKRKRDASSTGRVRGQRRNVLKGQGAGTLKPTRSMFCAILEGKSLLTVV